MARPKPKHDDAADPGPGGKGRRAPLTGGHWVTIKHEDGSWRHLYLQGRPGRESRAQRAANDAAVHGHAGGGAAGAAAVAAHRSGAKAPFRQSPQQRDHAAKLDFLSGGQVTGTKAAAKAAPKADKPYFKQDRIGRMQPTARTSRKLTDVVARTKDRMASEAAAKEATKNKVMPGDAADARRSKRLAQVGEAARNRAVRTSPHKLSDGQVAANGQARVKAAFDRLNSRTSRASSPAGPSLREQAAAHRATKGTGERRQNTADRIKKVRGKVVAGLSGDVKKGGSPEAIREFGRSGQADGKKAGRVIANAMTEAPTKANIGRIHASAARRVVGPLDARPAPPAAPAPTKTQAAGPSLKEQAAAHRARKDSGEATGETRRERAFQLRDRAKQRATKMVLGERSGERVRSLKNHEAAQVGRGDVAAKLRSGRDAVRRVHAEAVRSKLATQAARRAENEPKRFSLFGGKTPDAIPYERPPAPKAPAGPSLREQAAAKRATKDRPLDRVHALNRKLDKRARKLESRGDTAAASALRARKQRVTDAKDAAMSGVKPDEVRLARERGYAGHEAMVARKQQGRAEDKVHGTSKDFGASKEPADPARRPTHADILRHVEAAAGHGPGGLVPVHKVRELVAKHHGPGWASHENLDPVLRGMRRDGHLEATAVSDLRRLTGREIRDSIGGEGETIGYISRPRGGGAPAPPSLKERTRARIESARATKAMPAPLRATIAANYREARGAKAAPAANPEAAAHDTHAKLHEAFRGSKGSDAGTNLVRLDHLRERMGGTREQQDAAIRANIGPGKPYSLEPMEGMVRPKDEAGLKAAAIEGAARANSDLGPEKLHYITRRPEVPLPAAPAPKAPAGPSLREAAAAHTRAARKAR